MLDAVGSVSSLGFGAIDYVSMWSAAARAASTSSIWNQQQASSAASTSLWSSSTSNSSSSTSSANSSTTASSTASLSDETEGEAVAASTDAESEAEDSSLEEELEIARLALQSSQTLAHYAAQLSAGGAYIQGGASYTYEVGPDGKLYATAVSVPLDTNPVPGDPAATITKMQQVRAAALAPSSPSSSDFAAAATAMRNEMQARLELVQESANRYLGTTGRWTNNVVGSMLDAVA